MTVSATARPHRAAVPGRVHVPVHRLVPVRRLARQRLHVDRPREPLAISETVILLHPPLPIVGVSIGMERERQQNDSLVNG